MTPLASVISANNPLGATLVRMEPTCIRTSVSFLYLFALEAF